MHRLEILKRLNTLPFPVFTVADAARVIGEKRENVYVYLARMKKSGLIYEIEKGKYTTTKDPFQIATSLAHPSYISFLSGMSLYGMTDQIPAKIQVVTTRQKKSVVFQDMEVQFIRFRKSRVFGFKKIKRGEFEIFLAEPEKTIIDSLYLPKYAPVSESFSALLEGELDEEKLLRYAKKMDSKVVSKRLGYLLDLCGSDYREKLEISPKMEHLNP